MKTRRLLLIAGGVLAALLLQAASVRFHAQSQAPSALSGQVTSTEEGPMEGVLVSAKRTGGTITTTVVSDEKGRYAFPASRLEPGHYNLSVRAVGYDLEAPETTDIPASGPVTANLKLHKTSDLAAQLTNAE